MPSISGSSHEARVRAALESAFPTGLTAKQIQAVVSFSKLVRFRARSNNALYPLLGRVFGWCKATFTTVPVTTNRGQTFEALVVNVPVLFDGIEKDDKDTEEPMESE